MLFAMIACEKTGRGAGAFLVETTAPLRKVPEEFILLLLLLLLLIFVAGELNGKLMLESRRPEAGVAAEHGQINTVGRKEVNSRLVGFLKCPVLLIQFTGQQTEE